MPTGYVAYGLTGDCLCLQIQADKWVNNKSTLLLYIHSLARIIAPFDRQTRTKIDSRKVHVLTRQHRLAPHHQPDQRRQLRLFPLAQTL